MVRDIHNDMVVTKNARSNTPIFLFDIEVNASAPSGEVAWLRLAKWDANVDFFLPGTSTAQTYIKFPIRQSEIKENALGRTSEITLELANASREVQAFLEYTRGLRGKKVIIRQVFLETITEPTAYIQDIFYIDSCICNESAVRLTLSTQLDLLNITLPNRRYSRSHCQHMYKGQGCWLRSGSTYVAPSGFSIDHIALERNAVVQSPTGTSVGATASFLTRNAYVLDLAQDFLVVDLKIATVSLLTSGAYLKLSNKDSQSNDYLLFTNLGAFSFTDDTWQTITIALNLFTQIGTLNKTQISQFEFTNNSMAGVNTLYWRNLYLMRNDVESADTCDHSLVGCALHSNQARFGGQPGIPSRRIYGI